MTDEQTVRPPRATGGGRHRHRDEDEPDGADGMPPGGGNAHRGASDRATVDDADVDDADVDDADVTTGRHHFPQLAGLRVLGDVEPSAVGAAAALPTSRAGRNLPAAIGVGAALGAVILVSLFAYRPSFVALVVAAVGYGSYELVVALRTVEARPPLLPLLVGGAAMDVAAWFRGPDGLVVGLLVTACGLVVWRLADGAAGYLRDVSAATFALLYVPLLAGFAVLLASPHDGAARVIAFIGAVVCSDTGGYASGVLFGRHPLAPTVSKGKTWEGLVGSVLACASFGAIVFTVTFHQAWWQGALYGLAIAATATLGDLGESMMKRDLGLKDMGRLLPGHGGLMDRLDSLLPCAAVAYLLLTGFLDH